MADLPRPRRGRPTIVCHQLHQTPRWRFILPQHPRVSRRSSVDVPPVRPGRNSTSVNLLVTFGHVVAELLVTIDRTDPQLVDQRSDGDGDNTVNNNKDGGSPPSTNTTSARAVGTAMTTGVWSARRRWLGITGGNMQTT